MIKRIEFAAVPLLFRRLLSAPQAGNFLPRWSGGRAAEGGGLLNRYRVEKPYRGFESLPLRTAGVRGQRSAVRCVVIPSEARNPDTSHSGTDRHRDSSSLRSSE